MAAFHFDNHPDGPTPFARVTGQMGKAKAQTKMHMFPIDPGKVVLSVADVEILLAIVSESQFIRGHRRDNEKVCILTGKWFGQDGHNWTEWEEYLVDEAGTWSDRVCQRCGYAQVKVEGE